ncbi:hypothetical protein [Jannaschia ovalis]|uniref:Uncharacterized protein n=1 Tax=Jannaschia ovalis TaxID=3038773 RepID=A0ABY8L9G8_9RHOB|nr:hypothetical protein [Jannaschia sp. GRR-S6-38]WGH77929.1 hypothetical protein P8627_12925 [Jannaschia sp. GRR-S6-38]
MEARWTLAGPRDRIAFDGDPGLAASMQDWLGLSPFAAAARVAS